MMPMQALPIIDAALGDDWDDLNPTEEEIVEAARSLYAMGLLETLPGRYGRFIFQVLLFKGAS